MTIEELERLPNWQSTAVDNQTGDAIAIIRVDKQHYRLYDGGSMTTPYVTEIEDPEGGNVFSINEVREMFATHKISGLRGFLPD